MTEASPILLLETATDICSVGLAIDGRVVAKVDADERHMHSSHLTLFIDEVMREAEVSYPELRVVVLSNGPGSYTSLRVGAATAKGLCMALPQLRFMAVDTLTALARSAVDSESVEGVAYILATIDSRRNEVYGRLFTAAGDPLTEPDTLVFPEADLADYRQKGKVLVCGSGTAKARRLLGDSPTLDFATVLLPSASALLPLAREAVAAGRFQDYATYEPLYLKPPFVTKSTKKLL